jgi:hypothetical protein
MNEWMDIYRWMDTSSIYDDDIEYWFHEWMDDDDVSCDALSDEIH